MDSTWKSVPLREAEVRLDVALASLDATLNQVDEQFEHREETSLSDADIRKIEEHARSADAPRDLRELQKRVDAGEMTWRDITSGRTADDEGVRRALESGLPQMRQAYTLLEEGHSVDEVIEAGKVARRDDDDGDNVVLRDDAW
ncbi:MAG: hypothetical protein M3548_08190 [Actinomycetota bacterium]|nr:hypothetical protein [Actinomycetota bacterium]